jgi:hypothetical protein
MLEGEEQRNEGIESEEEGDFEEYVNDEGIYECREGDGWPEGLTDSWGEEDELENGFQRHGDIEEDEFRLEFEKLKRLFGEDDEREELVRWCQRVFNQRWDCKCSVLTASRRCFEWTKGIALKFTGKGLGNETGGDDYEDFAFETFEFIDLIHAEGVEHKALIGMFAGFAEIKLVCFKDWFRSFPVSGNLRLDFDLRGRTLHLATVGGMHWYIVMKPNGGWHRGRSIKGGTGTAMDVTRSGKLSNFILRVLMGSTLMHLGYNQSNYKGRWNRDLSSFDFRKLQEELMRGWNRHMVDDEEDEFWHGHEPTFHCICIGNNLAVSGKKRLRYVVLICG